MFFSRCSNVLFPRDDEEKETKKRQAVKREAIAQFGKVRHNRSPEIPG
jgi:hypothetical protein